MPTGLTIGLYPDRHRTLFETLAREFDLVVFENERATTIITSRDIEVAVVQIASRLVRQISSFVQVGQRVALGQRIGAIRLGSQVDVVLSDCNSLRVLVALVTGVHRGNLMPGPQLAKLR